MNDVYTNLDDMFDTPFQVDVAWFLPDGRHRKDIEAFFIGKNLEDVFKALPELNEYTKIASPGILKRFSVNGKSFVVKSVPPEEIAAQRNELKSSLAIFDTVSKSASTPITHFGFDLEITIPEAIFCTAQGRCLALMQLHPYPTLDEILVRANGDTDTIVGHLGNVRKLYDFFAQHRIFWRDMAPRNILVDQSDLSPRYIILDFEKTQVAVENIDEAEERFWRGAVISEEFLSACGFASVDAVFGDKYDPGTWNENEPQTMTRAEMRREISSIVYLDGERDLTIGAYNRLDKLLAKTRAPLFGMGRGDTSIPARCASSQIIFLGRSMIGCSTRFCSSLNLPAKCERCAMRCTSAW